MDTPNPNDSETLAKMARQHFLQSLCTSIPELDRLVVQRFEAFSDSDFRDLNAPSVPIQTWYQDYVLQRRSWAQGLLDIWRTAFVDPIPVKKRRSLEGLADIDDLQLISDDAIEGLIASSRMSMQVAEKVDPGFTELRKRLLQLEYQRLDPNDPVQPTQVAENLVDAWRRAGLPQACFTWVMEGITKEWAALLLKAYQASNAFLEERGISPKPTSAPAPLQDAASPKGLGPAQSAAAQVPAAMPMVPGAVMAGAPTYQYMVPAGGGVPVAGAVPSMGMVAGGAVAEVGAAAGGQVVIGSPAVAVAQAVVAGEAAPAAEFLAPQILVPGAPLPAGPMLQAPQARFGQPALQQVQALQHDVLTRMAYVVGDAVQASPGVTANGDVPETQPTVLTPRLMQVMQVQQAQVVEQLKDVQAQTAFQQSSPEASAQVAQLALQQSQVIKEGAEQPNEKAIIELVALMFQSVLSEDRVPSAVRVLFARLQVPVLRIALADPSFFTDMDHTVRRLIDRMGSAAMGFDGANFQGSALEQELRRIVQTIEQYPDMGVKVFQLALTEFERFLQKFLSENQLAGKAMSVAQQVEEKETLLVKFTIELRKMLQDLPIREEVRSFLFKTWAEVLAVCAVREGVKGQETLRFKRAAALLMWACSAKSSRTERRRVAQALPALLQRLRHGLTLVGVVDMAQQAMIQQINAWVQEAFLARSKAIPADQLKQVSARLENLENFIGHDEVDDIPLSRENVELMLGVELAGLIVLEEPAQRRALSPEVLEWARTRTVGEYFELMTQRTPDTDPVAVRMQYVWHSKQRHLHVLLAADGRSCLLKLCTLAAYFDAGLLVPIDHEGLMLRATRIALTQYQPPEDLLTVHSPLPPKALPQAAAATGLNASGNQDSLLGALEVDLNTHFSDGGAPGATRVVPLGGPVMGRGKTL
ncbi:hypothetical protein CLI92_12660 [Vandammella animalimorsus]|uniref:DUF1631 family protein n=1 Tax=Vandammella animalimorsus TaxID=2029117 RepID=A0A2A2T2H9_9BURK|nr:DUF1631 family protein [Vandammella animalimorsus]PAT31492.1 hypothetical protein CK626_09665 [Vandammella animalimorsus]PAX15675.1 hypothetical protein CLI92_12660 [Vandammella animalimorsus]PAX19830.1 hypothetical protein CLI93_06885 [Vandammella animalimorsus]